MTEQNEMAFVLRDIGINRAVDHADRATPDWSSKATALLEQFCRTLLNSGDTLTSEAVRSYATTHGLPEPPDKRAWGGVMLRAAKKGLIRKLGWTTATDPKVHCNPVSLWEVL